MGCCCLGEMTRMYPFFLFRHIDAHVVSPDGLSWRFTGFYDNPLTGERRFSWDLLRKLRKVRSGPWLVGGDFNEVIAILEKIGGQNRNNSAVLNFCLALDKCELSELGFTGPMITRINKRGVAANVQE